MCSVTNSGWIGVLRLGFESSLVYCGRDNRRYQEGGKSWMCEEYSQVQKLRTGSLSSLCRRRCPCLRSHYLGTVGTWMRRWTDRLKGLLYGSDLRLRPSDLSL